MSGPEMELWASGLNVWNQLSFFADSCEGEGGSGGGVPPAQDPRDVHSFVRVLRGAEVERPLSRLSYTLVKRDGVLQAAGFLPTNSGRCSSDTHGLARLYATVDTCAGLALDLSAELTKSTAALSQKDGGDDNDDGHAPLSDMLRAGVSPNELASSVKAALGDRRPGMGKTAAAYDAGFVVLVTDPSGATASGDTTTTETIATKTAATTAILTIGDERYPACLGRPVTASRPATTLLPVTALSNLPGTHVTKVSAGGYTLGALTAQGDLYCWGGGPGGGPGGGGSGAAGAGTKSAAAPATVAPWSETPEPVDAPDDKDIEDFALGDLHIVVLARDGTVYTRGSNSNGQLGVGKSVGREGVGAWTQVHLDLTPGHCVVGVDAGPRTTFILTARR